MENSGKRKKNLYIERNVLRCLKIPKKKLKNFLERKMCKWRKISKLRKIQKLHKNGQISKNSENATKIWIFDK